MRSLVLLMMILVATAGQAAEPLKQFSADQVMTGSGQEITSRLYVDGINLRTEMTMPGAPGMASIVNGEKKVLWILMPGNMYLEKSVASADDASIKAWSGEDGREHVGTETINGQECDKYRIKGVEQDMFLYTQIKTGHPVLMTTADQRVRIEWNNVKPGAQPASLFQLPPGYRKLALPALPGGFKLPGM